MEEPLTSSERTIVVYSPRNRLIVSIFVCMLIIAGLLYFIWAIASSMFSEDTFSLASVSAIVSLVEMLLVLVGLILFVGALIFNIRRLISREAALTIDAQGIAIRDYFPLGSIRLSWADIAALYGRRPAYSYLYIRLKKRDEFLQKYHPVQRFIFRFNPSNPDTPITVPTAFLAMPVPQILGLVRDRFGYELHRYEILVQM
jgi:hypothetical protein